MGEISVLKNGELWSGDIVALQHTFSEEKVDISIETFTKEGIHLDDLLLFKGPKASGRYKLSYTTNQPPDDSLVGAKYIHGYDDGVDDSYDLAVGDSTSYLEITEYNDSKGEFRATFN